MDRVVWSAKVMQMRELDKSIIWKVGKEKIVLEKTIHDGFTIHPMMKRIGDVFQYYLEKKHQSINTSMLLNPKYNAAFSRCIDVMTRLLQKYGPPLIALWETEGHDGKSSAV